MVSHRRTQANEARMRQCGGNLAPSEQAEEDQGGLLFELRSPMHAHAHTCPSKEAACRPMRRLLSDQLPPPVVLVPCPFHLFPSARDPTHLTSSQCGRIVPPSTLRPPCATWVGGCTGIAAATGPATVTSRRWERGAAKQRGK